MDQNQSDRVLAFDSLFTTNHIQILKLLVGYMEPSLQGKLAVYIKFQELYYTLKLITNHPSLSMSSCFSSPSCNSMTTLIDEIGPFCAPKEKEKLQNIRNMYQSWENMQEMMEMMEFLKEMSPELFSKDATASPDFSQILNMSQGTDMSQMTDIMNMMQSMFASQDETERS